MYVRDECTAANTTFVGEILDALIDTGCIALFFRHKGADKGGELVDATLNSTAVLLSLS